MFGRRRPRTLWLPGNVAWDRSRTAAEPWENDHARSLGEALEAQREATEKHAAAMREVGHEMKRQTALAQATVATSNYQATKYLADALSGQLGRGVVARSSGCGSSKPSRFERAIGQALAFYALYRIVRFR